LKWAFIPQAYLSFFIVSPFMESPFMVSCFMASPFFVSLFIASLFMESSFMLSAAEAAPAKVMKAARKAKAAVRLSVLTAIGVLQILIHGTESGLAAE
jgi:hypothetical protein